jgi:nicotinate phosphoribosyltransferase
VNAGLEDVLDFLESYHFNQDELDHLRETGLFGDDFLHFLSTLEFTGSVRAMPEGRIFFTDEPVLEVTAPIIEAQLVETFIINTVSLQSLIAGKAARCVHAAQGRNLVDFSLRRTQGSDAGLKVARASYLAGFSGTSNVLAGKLYGIPVSGTMAHSFITSFSYEEEAFRAFAKTFPDATVLLIDTFDTVEGARKAVKTAKEMNEQGHRLVGVRLDSGDMVTLSRQVREILDEAGMNDTQIFASGGFDEFKIKRYVESEALIDAFGVGTKMGVSADTPYFDIAYKLVQYAGEAVLKLSSGKKTLVGEKQVFRHMANQHMAEDTIALKDENLPGEPLLHTVMDNGRRVTPRQDLATARDRLARDLAQLPDPVKRLETPDQFPVRTGPALNELQTRVVHAVREKELGES